MRAIRGRFAPSPTGSMHLGNAWAALLGWLAVRSQGGRMVLRIEDLDPERSRPEYMAGLLEDLAWLGLDWDEGPDKGGPYEPYVQSQRLALYDEALSRLAERGLVYPCYCTRKELRTAASAPHAGEEAPLYGGACRLLGAEERRKKERAGRSPAMRLRCPAESVSFTDLLHGRITVDPALTAGDFALRRSDGVHAYQLAVVVDDGAMDINLVVRGADLLSSTPAQVALFKLLGYAPPDFLHVPLLVDSMGVRLSKRHGSLEIRRLRMNGARPEAVLGYLAWKAGLMPELRSIKTYELLEPFNPARIPSRPLKVEDDAEYMILGA
ncbi:tRNA glutamyl-Q(34) synthetase GluQRS [Desulfocurvibacter africanus]|uniref:Glutamyl-Q tRNA(Asp) synthetase n=1 Tax=Desulfocurvibacter africanus subsp. africanus str. Walvis Bay TaxID=690850 RepID=F3YYA2_DESAF|nr:tRNA glutamyl-Q(34) synthetase GluQRS [Desulfocurvibacter africanus]EGJ49546.1 Glutamyl-Q tRNA(Asp) synthetase [Desulfocurvibacter africanus subsp. africanus str. Walvis Bay]